ncbi:MAG: TIGR02710 family CRISPR-associated protein [Planctomycetes bacterium]|nr:TIGR02710 family CRISPR-associated protein [Planctomycetota bacterium]
MNTLLICTLGGSVEPIVASIKKWNPVRIAFVPTPQTSALVASQVVPLAAAERVPLDPGRYDTIELPDGQDFTSCVDLLRRRLAPSVQEWLARGADYQVVVDFTGGTKCMSAALALVARKWHCLFSYVGGTERTKDGVGIVVSGKEQVLHADNPWDSLGAQAVEDFVVLFDEQAYAAASMLANQSLRHVTGGTRKREFSALAMLADAYNDWDRFDHRRAADGLRRVVASQNDLAAVLGPLPAERIVQTLDTHIDFLDGLLGGRAPNVAHVVDLLANAGRRKAEGRVDDSVARLYRAIESIAQLALADRHGIPNTKRIPIDRIPDALRGRFESRKDFNGLVFMGLQDAYRLLDGLGDQLGAAFRRLRLHEDDHSPLTARNQSILAHGFQRVSDKVIESLWTAATQLSGVVDDRLPTFPKLGL